MWAHISSFFSWYFAPHWEKTRSILLAWLACVLTSSIFFLTSFPFIFSSFLCWWFKWSRCCCDTTVYSYEKEKINKRTKKVEEREILWRASFCEQTYYWNYMVRYFSTLPTYIYEYLRKENATLPFFLPCGAWYKYEHDSCKEGKFFSFLEEIFLLGKSGRVSIFKEERTRFWVERWFLYFLSRQPGKVCGWFGSIQLSILQLERMKW